MQAKHQEVVGFVTTAVLAVVVALVALGSVIRLAQNAANLGPRVGDILDFAPGHKMTYDNPPQITAQRAGLPSCVLDISTMHRLGGSLVIEARSPLPNRIYTLQWAGRHTSIGPADCGGSAELRLTQDNLDALALAVGGFGISHQQLAENGLWRSGGSPPAAR